MSSTSPDLIKWQTRCLNLIVVKASQSQWMSEAVSDVCLHLLHSGLFTNCSLNRCPFNWQCPVSSHAIFLSRFLLNLNNSPTFFVEGFLIQPLACPFPHVDCQCSWKVLQLIQPQISPLATLAGILRVGWSHMSGCYKLCLASWSAVSFPSIFISSGTHTSRILLCSANFTRDWLAAESYHTTVVPYSLPPVEALR